MTPLLLTSVLVFAAPAPRVVTLDDALNSARQAQPTLRQARAQTEAAWARAGESRSALLPSLVGSAAYSRLTGNFTVRPGQVPSNLAGMPMNSFDTFNFFNFGLTVSQLLYDSQVSIDKYRAARQTAGAQYMTERATLLTTELNVRVAFFTARANKALVEVAKRLLENQERHLQQIQGFVEVGTRPDIDLAQARTDRANAVVQVIQSQNTYSVARTGLNVAMGRETDSNYEVSDDTLPPVPGEDGVLDELVDEAWKGRPDAMALERQIRAQELVISSTKGQFGPALSTSMSLTDNGVDITKMAWNWNLGVNLAWNIFSGLNTWEQVKEQKAILKQIEAQRDGLRQQVHQAVESAKLSVASNKAAVAAAEEALTNARERLRLAEGRYQAGVGNVIELGDAQLALTQAAAQRVQAEYNLATARAQLLYALGRH